MSIREVEIDQELLPMAQFDYSTVPKTLLNPGTVFEEVKVLGKGAFGEVRLVREATTGKPYALKYLNNANPELLREEIGSLREISGYPDCKKDYVCYYDAFQFRDKDGKLKYGILMEYITGETLDKYVREHKVDKRFLKNLALWLTAALATLHEQGFSHRDVKPTNIMITPDNQAKLIDFGLTCIGADVDSDAPVCTAAINGTPGYMPPDLTLGGQLYNLVEHLQSADVFAAGVSLFQAANEMREPYRVVDDLHVSEPALLSRYNYPCYNKVVNEMLTLEYYKRPSAALANLKFSVC